MDRRRRIRRIHGFGAAGHVAIQIARARGADVYVCTRDRDKHRALADVANNTREDGHRFLGEAAAVPVRSHTEVFPLEEANEALHRLAHDGIRGAAVLRLKES